MQAMNARFSRHSRRSFLELCGGSAALAMWLQSAVARAQNGTGQTKRLMILHRPNGSIQQDWLSNGQPGPILKPFAKVWPSAVALKGVNVRPGGAFGAGHEAGLVTLMTGEKVGAVYKTNDDYRTTAASLDFKLRNQSPVLSAKRALHLAANGSQDGGNEIPNTALSYSAAAAPTYPTLKPDDVYNDLFAGMVMPGADTSGAALAKARQKSVLDFIKGDLTRVQKKFPSAFRNELDVHTNAIREMEDALAQPTPQQGCAAPAKSNGYSASATADNVAAVGKQHLALVTAAFACDFVRTVTFMWGTGASLTNFQSLGTSNHHSTSHGNDNATLSKVDQWYSEQTAPFIQKLVDTADVGGSKLIDNTLVWYISEVSRGVNHSFDDYPFVLFGGDGVGLKTRERVLDVSKDGRTSNDVWTSLAPSFGGSLTSFGTSFTSAIPGLFST